MQIGWRTLRVLDKGFQRTFSPLKGPQGNVKWYRIWYKNRALSKASYQPSPVTLTSNAARNISVADSLSFVR